VITHQRDFANKDCLFTEEEDLVEVLLDHADTKLSPESLQYPCARFVIVDDH
jgi:hypothetical protein